MRLEGSRNCRWGYCGMPNEMDFECVSSVEWIRPTERERERERESVCEREERNKKHRAYLPETYSCKSSRRGWESRSLTAVVVVAILMD